VTFGNTGDARLDFPGWTVTDAGGTMYTFPSGVTLGPGTELTLYTGRGTDTDAEFYWGRTNGVRENSADTVTVILSDGNT
jgi:hypothetical protein